MKMLTQKRYRTCWCYTKWLNEYRTTFLNENHIVYQYSRKKHGRQISLAKRAGDSGDGGDSDIGIPPVTVIEA